MIAVALLPPTRGTIRTTPAHGRPRCVIEHAAQHVWRHKLLWWITAAAATALSLQLGLGHSVHHWLYG